MKVHLQFSILALFLAVGISPAVFAHAFVAQDAITFDDPTLPGAYFGVAGGLPYEPTITQGGVDSGETFFLGVTPLNPGLGISHLHGANRDLDTNDVEMLYEADAGGWTGALSSNNEFALISWDQIALNDVLGVQNPTDLVIDGYRNGVQVATTTVTFGTTGSINFLGRDSGFEHIDLFDVYFDGFKNVIPPQGLESAIDDLVLGLAAPVPVPPAIYLFGSALVGFFSIGRRKHGITT